MNIAIIGSGMIANETLATLQNLPSIQCKSLFAREHSLEKAKALAIKFNIETVTSNYKSILEDKSIDFVYIGIVNSEHYNFAKEALLAHKNVIIEKPFTATLEQAKELQTLAINNNLFLFEAITTIHSPNFTLIKELLPQIGQVKAVQANFSQYSSRYDRYLQNDIAPVFNPALCGGALYDINIYNLHFVVGLFGKAENAHYYANKGHNGIDTSGVLLLTYKDFYATLLGAKDSSSENFLSIQGDKGFIHIASEANFLQNIQLVLNKNNAIHYNEERNTERMIQEWQNFEKIFKAKDYASSSALLSHTIDVMEHIEQVRFKF